MSSQTSSADPKPKKEPSWWWLLLTPVMAVIGWIGMGATDAKGILGFFSIFILGAALYFPILIFPLIKLTTREDNNRPFVHAYGLDIIRYAPDAETALAGLEKAGWRRPVYINDK